MKKLMVKKGNGGYGGPLEINLDGKKNKILYVTGGAVPAILPRILELTGFTAVNGFKTTVPDAEVALAIVDCGGVVRCGVYPQKGIPTINIRNTGKSGPFAKYMEPSIYVSGVTKDNQITLVTGED